jgi:hypothetical protein
MNFVGTTVLKQSAPSEGLGRLLLEQTLSKHIGRLYLVQATLKNLNKKISWEMKAYSH